jgi:hypothetical protein
MKLILETDEQTASAWGALNALEWMDAHGPGLSDQSRAFAVALRKALEEGRTLDILGEQG